MNENAIVFVPGSTSRADFERCVRTVKARMNAFQRGPLFFYSPTSSADGTPEPASRLEQVRALTSEVSAYDVPSETAYMMRTSGSTSGTGKIVLLSTECLVASARATEQALGGGGRWTVCLPPAHIAGFQTIFRSLLAGTDPIWAANGKPEDIVKATRTYRSGERAYLSLVPVQLTRLLEDAQARHAAKRYDAILVGGSACRPSTLEQARDAGLNIVQTYGMTETCGGCVYDGYPIGDTALVADSEGRISISGSCVALGYAGGARFDGTFHTSDCGGITDGKLEIFGRIDKAITSGGVTVIPEVLERNIEEIFDTQVAVIGVDDEKWGQAIIACIDKEIPSAREVLKEKLEVGWTPQRFVSLSELGFSDFPRLPSGKIDRNALTSLVIASF